MKQWNRVKRRVFSFILSLTMVLGQFPAFSITALAADKELAIDTVWGFGDSFVLSEQKYFVKDDYRNDEITADVVEQLVPGKYALSEANYISVNGQYSVHLSYFEDPESVVSEYFDDVSYFYMVYGKVDGTGYVAGIKLVSGDGTQVSPYRFEIVYEEPPTIVSFNGKPWCVIAGNSLSDTEGTLTLLAADTSFGLSVFSDNDSNVYSDSKIKAALDAMTAEGGSFAGVADAIVTNNEAGGKLYLLSVDEAWALPVNVREIEFTGGDCEHGEWWLRTPSGDEGCEALVEGSGEGRNVNADGVSAYMEYGVRPALQLDLSKVTYDSEKKEYTVISGGGSSTVAVTGVTLDKTTAQTISVNESISFNATVQPDDATDKKVKWSVSGNDSDAVSLYSDEACTNVVGADATETLTVYAKGVSAGTATVTVTSNADDTKTASCDVTVNAGALDGVITSANFSDYFDENGYLKEFVAEGSVLDFRGTFSKDALIDRTNNGQIYINKKVDITSSTEDAVFLSENATNYWRLNIVAGADYTTVSDLEFSNGALYIIGASNVTVDNITIIANMRGIGSGTGFVSIHTGAANAVVKNSYFENGGTGTACLLLGKGSDHIVLENNIFRITGSSGNVISANQFVGSGNNPSNNTYKNNIIDIEQGPSAFCYAMTVNGSGNLVEGNTIKYGGSILLNQYGATSTDNVYRNNVFTGGGSINPSANSKVEDNIFEGTVNMAGNTVFTGNTVSGNITLSASQNQVSGNTVSGNVTMNNNATNTRFTGNTVKGTVNVKANECTISSNSITSTGDYAVVLTASSTDVEYNSLVAAEKEGDDAVDPGTGTDNIIQNNTGIVYPPCTVTKAPEAKKLTYTGQAQELVTAGEADGGTMQYTISSNAVTAPTTGWSTDIPKAAIAGTYYVWYYVKGDAEHSDSDPVCITAEILNPARITKAPTASENLVYNGSAQTLLKAGTAIGGTMVYAAGTDAETAPAGDYSETILTATDAGTYYVWYKAVGDADHIDSDAYCVVITIEKKDISTIATVKQAEGQSLSYNGAAQKPDITVSVNGVILTEGSDYTVTYAGTAPTVYAESADAPIYAGTYMVIVSYMGNYSGRSVMDFTIDKKLPPEAEQMPGEQKPISVSGNAAVYTGGEVSLVTPPASLPDGYTGVMYSIDGGVTWTSEIPTVVEAGTYTVKVKYVADADHEDFIADDIVITIDPARYTISFNANGGRGTMADQEVILSKPSDKAALNSNLFKHYEFNFAGWNTKADGSGTAYADAAEITPAADMVLYAQWSNVGDVWNLFEDNSEHTYVLYGVYAEKTIANSNARSSKYYDATISGNKISVKLKAGVQRNTAAGAANSVLEFTQADGSVITYTLPVSYVKPQLKLSANTYTIKDGVDSVAETTVLIRKAGGNYEPIAFGAGDVVTFVGKAAAVSADGKVSISANGKASGRLIVKKAGWDKEIALTFTVKADKKDVISVDLGGAKSVTLNTNAAGQKFSYPVYLNGKRATAADGITLSDASGVASYSDGTLTVAYKNGVKSGTRNVTLKKGNVSTIVKVKVSTMTLDKSVTLATQSRYDVVTGQSMVFVPKFTGIDGRITRVELTGVGKCDKNDFYAEINAAGNIVVSYDGNALNAKNLVIGDMGFKLTVTDTEGNDTVINKVVKNVKAKKSMPKVTAVKMSASKDANGNTLGVVNIVSTYRDAKGATHTIAPVSAKIIGLTNVEAKVNANDPSQIDISNTKGIKGSGNIKVELTYPGGVTKKITIRVNKIAK